VKKRFRVFIYLTSGYNNSVTKPDFGWDVGIAIEGPLGVNIQILLKERHYRMHSGILYGVKFIANKI
jgi:hypothetical protein